ncbi:MAG: DNA gyrase subunit A [Candidatus Izimaplasma bacterium HR2]|nr:MAG: DNA gyrase subunit A [Candidatus Izimaplasma bacterium HR2]
MDRNNIKIVNLKDEMESSYLDYAMSVITDRALPDVRDGLKPVHRRILYTLFDLGMLHNKPYKKSIRVVGEVLGKLHPHGDVSVYEAMMRMAQKWSLRYPLVDGHGNIGSQDGDKPAASRYTEARMSQIAKEMLWEIKKNVIDMKLNFSEDLYEPIVLSNIIPTLIINGVTGIAVGMATSMPSHNMNETIDAIIAYMENTDITTLQLMNYIIGPDFPTGGIVINEKELLDAYSTGKGRIRIRAKASIKDKTISITEIPYLTYKEKIVGNIGELIKAKEITEIKTLRDDSDRNGMCITIIVKKDADANAVLNRLYKLTSLETTFSFNNTVLINGSPETVGLKILISEFVKHQINIYTRKYKFDLEKIEKRLHIIEGLIIAIENIDDIVKLIKASSSKVEANSKLIKKYKLTQLQADAILAMKLSSLTNLEVDTLKKEQIGLLKSKKEIEIILNSESILLGIIKDSLLATKKKYGDARRTQITNIEITKGDKAKNEVPSQNVVVTFTHGGLIKRVSTNKFKPQTKGGKGKKINNIYSHVFIGNTQNYMLAFSNYGNVFKVLINDIKEGDNRVNGAPIASLVNLDNGEEIVVVSSMEGNIDDSLIFITKNGKVKKTKLSEYQNFKRSKIKAINLKEGDSLVNVRVVKPREDIIMYTKDGYLIRFSNSSINSTGRSTGGVNGIKVKDGDRVIGFDSIDKQKYLMTISREGKGKKIPVSMVLNQVKGGVGLNVTKKQELAAIIPITNESITIFTNTSMITLETVDIVEVKDKCAVGVKLIDSKNVVAVIKL